jgi:SOS-response transcriptional repressor LexA
LKKQEFRDAFERVIGSKEIEKSDLFFSDVVPPGKEEYIDFLPVYTLEATCGKFGEGREAKISRWVDVQGLRLKGKDTRRFVSQVKGDSMEPRINDGDYCLFQADVVGARDDKIVLVQHHSINDLDNGGRYTVKKYKSYKSKKPGKLNERVELIPLNKKHDTIVLQVKPTRILKSLPNYSGVEIAVFYCDNG